MIGQANRIAAAVSTACLAVLLAGCATVPTGGPTFEGRGGGAQGQVDTFTRLLPAGPQPGWGENALVRGFLKDLGRFEENHEAARLYMTEECADVWQPSDRVLVYDRGGNRFRVENRTESLFEGTTAEGEDIITASIGSKGNIALGTLSGSATSRLTVWNSTYDKKEFVWNCSDYSITSTALSENGKYVAVSVMGAKDGDTYSKIYVFDFEYSDPVSETEYPGTAMLAVNFTDNDTVVGVGDNKISFLKNLKKNTEIDYGTSSLSTFTFSPNGRTILILAEYGSQNHQLLRCYTENGRSAFEEPYDVYIKSVYASDSRISVLTSDYIDIYGIGGTRRRAREAGSSAILAEDVPSQRPAGTSGAERIKVLFIFKVS